MKLSGSRTLPAPQEAVWAKLNDVAVLKRCIPGCEKLEQSSPTDLSATVALKIGPVSARFNGDVQLSNLNPPNSYTISGSGKGGAAGFASGAADVVLSPADGGTLLTFESDANVGGRIAQLGSRLIDATAHKLANQFFDRFAEEFGEDASASVAAAGAAAGTGTSGAAGAAAVGAAAIASGAAAAANAAGEAAAKAGAAVSQAAGDAGGAAAKAAAQAGAKVAQTAQSVASAAGDGARAAAETAQRAAGAARDAASDVAGQASKVAGQASDAVRDAARSLDSSGPASGRREGGMGPMTLGLLAVAALLGLLYFLA